MAEEKNETLAKLAILEGKIDKLLIMNIGLVQGHAEIVEQQAEIIEKLANITLSGDGFSYGLEN